MDQTRLRSLLRDTLRKEGPKQNAAVIYREGAFDSLCTNPLALSSAVAVFVAALLVLFPPSALGSPPSAAKVGVAAAAAFGATFGGMVLLGARV